MSDSKISRNTRFLVYGAGAIGSLFAGKLVSTGYDVTLLARGKRLNALRDKGLILEDALSGKTETSYPSVIEKLDPLDIYDFIIVAVQNIHVESILPILAENSSPNIVFVVNNPAGYEEWKKAVGAERILIGFPSAGGERKNDRVLYFIGKGPAKLFQSTTFGELNGEKSPRLKLLVSIFRKAGFSPEIHQRMGDWQKTHVSVVVPIARALYRFQSDNYRLARSYSVIRHMILATREGFAVLKSLGVPITPFKLRFYYFPVCFLAPLYMLIFRTRIAEFSMAKHTIAAKNEMDELDRLFRDLIEKSGKETPFWNTL